MSPCYMYPVAEQGNVRVTRCELQVASWTLVISFNSHQALSHLLSELYAFEPLPEISNNLVCVTSKGSDQSVHTRSLIRAFACRLNILSLLSY